MGDGISKMQALEDDFKREISKLASDELSITEVAQLNKRLISIITASEGLVDPDLPPLSLLMPGSM